MVVWIRPPTCGLPVAIHEFVVYQDPTGCLTAFRFSPFEVRDDSNPSGDGLLHLNRIKIRRGCHKNQAGTSPRQARQTERATWNTCRQQRVPTSGETGEDSGAWQQREKEKKKR